MGRRAWRRRAQHGGPSGAHGVVTAESTKGNVVYVTDWDTNVKRQGKGWLTPGRGMRWLLPALEHEVLVEWHMQVPSAAVHFASCA